MKPGPLLVTLSLAALLGTTHAQEAASPINRLPDLPLPTARRSVIIAPDERNPFGVTQVSVTNEFGVVQGETEESKLRSLITRFSVSGITVGSDGRSTVILGPLTVRQGQQLPELMPNQIERIVVNEITADEVKFGFVDREGNSSIRTFAVPYNLTPKVRFALPSDMIDSQGEAPQLPLSGLAGPKANEGL